MAEETTVLKSFLTCQVCCETFKDPVSLGCHHNFCSSCLQRFWVQAKNKNCPTCRRKSSKDATLVNFGLQELVDAHVGRRRADPAKSEAVCREHTQDLKWFCKEEQRAVCHLCQFPHFHGHTLVPIKDVVPNLKEQLELDLRSLKAKREKYQEIYETYDDMAQHCKKQRLNTERQIRAEFNQLRRFLNQEEEARLAALREEEEQKRKAIMLERKNIHEQISTLSESISAVERDLAQKDNAAFLTSYKDTQTSARVHCSGSDPPQPLPGGLVDVAKHLGNLSFRVWEKMREERIKFTPVIFDPNTASNSLCLSEDLTSVRYKTKPEGHPDNPERFMSYSNVLGSEGFSSGEHSWEVEVGDHPHWLIGVTKESVERRVVSNASPGNGIWCLMHFGESYSNCSGRSFTFKRSPQRIRVELDCDKGEVSFYNPEDMAHIYTYEDTFSEKIYPFFCVGQAGEEQTIDVKVCDIRVSISNIMPRGGELRFSDDILSHIPAQKD